MKLLLDYCVNTGAITDSKGMRVVWALGDIPVGFEGSTGSLTAHEYCDLLGVGLDKKEIEGLLKEGVIRS